MAVSDIDICNLALGRLAAAPITSLTENSVNSERCNRFYQVTYDKVLRSFNWKCAIARAALGSTDTPAFEWGYAYTLPVTPLCLRVIEMDHPSYEFDVEGRLLLTDQSTAKIRYVSRAPTGNLDALCAEAVYVSLAIELAYPITSDRLLKADLIQEYREEIIPNATKANVIEQLKPDYDKVKSGWLDARVNGTFWGSTICP